jgi:hypothetical protein
MKNIFSKIFLGRFEEKNNLKLVFVALVSLFYVMFVWNFWSRGIYALGVNFSIFLLLMMAVFSWELIKQNKITKEISIWLIPVFLIILSFSFYDNPFLKVTTLLSFPIIFVLFYNYAFLDNRLSHYWGIDFFREIIKRFFSFFRELGKVNLLYTELLIPANKQKREIIAKVLLGLVLFVIIALIVFIPLLSSADSVFDDKMQIIYDYIKDLIAVSTMYKIAFFILFSIIMSSILLAWGKSFSYEEKEESGNKADSIITGIVLGGILLIYVLFLWIQIEKLWVGALPFEFREVESFVKSGFWQLLFLSIINILIYFFTYRKTIPLVQWILMAFTFASFLLLSSAGQRMFLYVKYYGFSYEKFLASYTVIYCIILFIWLITRLFINKRSNIVKFIILLFVWMYSLLVIFPVEQFILRANVQLSQLEDSRIDLYESSMLSPDVLSLVKKYEDEDLDKLKKTEDKYDRFNWGDWVYKKENIIWDKEWYEYNLMNLRYVYGY